MKLSPCKGKVPEGADEVEAAFGKILNNGAFASRGELRSPANVAFGTMSPEKANGMIRWCIHSLSLGLWPIQLPRRGSLGYVLLFLALSYLYRHTQKAFPL